MASFQSPTRRPLGTLKSPNVQANHHRPSSASSKSTSSNHKSNMILLGGSSSKKSLSSSKSPVASAKKRAKTAVTPTTRRASFTMQNEENEQPQAETETTSLQNKNQVSEQLLELLQQQYPSKVRVPSRKTIGSLYHSALKEEDGDQDYLKPAGILSLEQVFLPAVAHEENVALKQWEAKAKRDTPELVPHIRQARTMICESVGLAILAASEARQERLQRAADARAAKALAAEQAKAQKKQERLEQKQRQQVLQEQRAELERSQRLAQQRNEHPRNKELWAEVLELTMELNRLKKEAKQWKIAQAQLKESSSFSSSMKKNEDTQTAENSSPETIQVPKHELCDTLESQLASMDISSKRIQQGIKIVLETLQETTKLRTQLYNQYRKDHQFHGYQGVKDPKAMIRFLSQDE